ncbi:5'-nucleotidase C-terminal domain-containing protein [Rhodobacter sp. KR11]|uniref:bifunctional metallophosphatase/5'-nucleotidase n=1 Tax=Rhodobacter sp. KR11 TaxID=2974588 RepID=UPI0022236290|nr:5'-nucleotidase C-terminal domain-containing protein [Rhodobacter sp. KR11]MCW1918356.1 5'-nucleotidase C-terminal domain-containing protein [Rhodobacter sp. KR11]
MTNHLKILALLTLAAGPLAAEPVKITLLGVGDVYAFDGDGKQGGFARLNAVARAERAANPNTLYLFDGDMLSPSLISGFDKGQNTVDLTNIVPFDLAVPGNHEFDFGPANFAEKMKASKYPWAAINLQMEGLGGVVIKEVAGVKIALIPVAQDTSPQVSNTGDLTFAPTVDSAIEAARAARETADLVVGVVQTDVYNDLKLIHSKAFDVVLSGDDHHYATSYDGVTAYVETSVDARMLAPLDLMVDVTEKDGKRVVKWVPTFRFIDTATVTPDPETQALVDSYRADLDAKLGAEIGTSETALDSRRNVVRGEESAMGNLIADAMRAAVGADVALMNGGGIRADRTYDAGIKLTRRDMLTELPFGNTVQLTELPGSQLLAALENAVSQVEKGAGRFAQVSGLAFTYDASAEPGKRVSAVTVAGKPLEAATLYKVAVNNFMLEGGDGYDALGGGRMINDTGAGVLVANAVMDYVETAGTVSPAVEGRITRLGD